ncbi:hypothetical protein BAE44_0014810 [Dichanthelium oligosanthes]|uniref:THH1/TOM1/TOM3 domain-containing protein n=1 Tax=Dichanthelium oligosanthes TaxID=888268 RepID=A0A1E5VGD0_9POAL|nr:hypothetical protein BAE44_0014810 [Dichanthelium oligosanthes]
MAAAPAPLPATVAGWWELVNGSPAWQDGIFYALAALYGIIAASSFIQVAKIQRRVPEYGWTIQKVFQFLNFVVNGELNSSCSFLFQIFQHVILDLPGLAFFTTYALLALFWAEILYQARGLMTNRLRSGFYTINGAVYVLQVKQDLLLVKLYKMCFNAFNKEADLDVLDHPILNLFYYLLVEILPSSLVLYILRRIPAKLQLSQYEPLSSG